jgi:hypothetical protein
MGEPLKRNVMFFPSMMKVIQLTTLLLLASFTASLIFSACVSSSRGVEMTAEEKKSAIDATLEWARLAPFSSSAQEFTIRVEGGSFTRSFRAHFKAPKHDIDNWVKQSPGLMSAEPTYANGKRTYIIRPGGGANRAQVTIGDDDSVEIYTSWS